MIKTNNKLLVLGKIYNPYGILGWLKISSFTSKKSNIFNYLPWFFIKNNNTFNLPLKNWKKHKKNFIIKIHNVENRSDANYYKKCDILVYSNTLPKLNKKQYYWKDIIGCTVINTNQKILGVITHIINTPSNDILVVKNEYTNFFKKKEILIPFVIKKIIINVDIFKKIIQVKLEEFFENK